MFTAPTLGQGLGLESLGNFTNGLLAASMPTLKSMAGKEGSKYTCEKCHGNKFASRDAGALMVCKTCGHILTDHVENVE